MDKNLQNIEDLFKNALDDNEEIPASKVWDEIDKSLDKENVISIKKKYDKLKKVSFLLLCLLICLSVYEFRTNRFTNSIKVVNKEVITKNDIFSYRKKNSINKINSKSTAKNNNQPQAVIKKTVINKEPGLNTAYSILQPKNTNPLLAAKRKSLKLHEKKQDQVDNDSETKTEKELKQLYKLHSSLPELSKSSTNTGKIRKPPKYVNSNQIKNISNQSGNNLDITKKKERKPSKLSLSVFFSPDFAFYKLKDENTDNEHENLADIEKGEDHEFSSSAGVLLNYKLNKKLSLQTGLTFSNISINVHPKTIYAQPDFSGNIKYRLNTSSGYGYVLPSFSSNPNPGDSLYTFTSEHTLRYFSLPLSLKYNIPKGRFNFSALAGISANYLMSGKIETTVESPVENEMEVIKKIQGLKKIYFSGLTGLAVDYNINKKVAVTFTPVLKFALNSINNNSPVKSYPNSFGLGVGFTFGL